MWVMPHQGYRITVTEIAAARAATSAQILIPPPRAMAARFVLGPAINSLILVAMLLLPLPVATITFLALPVMRHRHRIRLAHLWRLAAYAALGASVAGATVVLVADLIPSLAGLRVFAGRIRYEGLIRAVGGESSSRAATLAWAACLILPIIGTTIWWTWATNRYLRLSRPLPVALAVAAVGSLASLAVLQSAFGVLV